MATDRFNQLNRQSTVLLPCYQSMVVEKVYNIVSASVKGRISAATSSSAIIIFCHTNQDSKPKILNRSFGKPLISNRTILYTADCFAAEAAIEQQALLVKSEPEFHAVQHLVKVEQI